MRIPLILSEIIHFFVSTIIVILFWNSVPASLLLFFVYGITVFVDTDHLLDYGLYLYKSRKKPSLTYFLTGKYFKDSNCLYILFHSWEIPIVLFVLYFLTNNVIFLVIACSFTGHYIVDYCTNFVRPESYFFFFRYRSGFTNICA